MAQLQQINKHQLRDHIIDASHIDITTAGKSLLTKIIPGAGLALDSYTGVDAGTGVVTLKLDDTLTSLANLTSTGLLVRLADGSTVSRSLAVSANLTLTDAAGLTANPTLDLSNTGIVAGTYKYLQVDEKGRAVAGLKRQSTWVANEILADSGDHQHYTISHAPVSGTLMVFVSGGKMLFGPDKDFTISGTAITFTSPNLSVDVVSAAYFWSENGVNEQDMQHEALTPLDSGMLRYRLSNIPLADSQLVFLNGLLQTPGASNDYVVDGADIVFTSPTVSADNVSALYFI